MVCTNLDLIIELWHMFIRDCSESSRTDPFTSNCVTSTHRTEKNIYFFFNMMPNETTCASTLCAWSCDQKNPWKLGVKCTETPHSGFYFSYYQNKLIPFHVHLVFMAINNVFHSIKWRDIWIWSSQNSPSIDSARINHKLCKQ